jgi:ATP synthase protein I
MHAMRDLDARRARQILFAQAVTTLGATLLGLAFGPRHALFAFIGGAIALSANALFAYWVFGRYRAREPGKLLARFFLGETVKLVFVAALFVAVFTRLDPLSPLALFGAFFVVQVLPPLLANRIAG